MPTALERELRDPGSGRPSWVIAIRSPATKASGRPGTERSSWTHTRPTRSSAHAQVGGQRAGADAGRPQHRVRGDGLVTDLDVTVAQIRHARSGAHLDAQRLELPLRLRATAPPGTSTGSRAPASTRMTRVVRGSKRRKSRASVRPAISASAPASSTPVGPPPITTNVVHARRNLGDGLQLGGLERAQDPPAHVQRFAHGLQPGGKRRPLVVAEVRVGHPRGEDQVVVVDVAALDEDALLLDLDALDRTHEDGGVALAPEELAYRRRDVRGRQRRRRDLVEQRLEQVMIALVDEGDADAGDVQPPRRGQPREPRPENDDVRLFLPEHHRASSVGDDRRRARFDAARGM